MYVNYIYLLCVYIQYRSGQGRQHAQTPYGHRTRRSTPLPAPRHSRMRPWPPFPRALTAARTRHTPVRPPVYIYIQCIKIYEESPPHPSPLSRICIQTMCVCGSRRRRGGGRETVGVCVINVPAKSRRHETRSPPRPADRLKKKTQYTVTIRSKPTRTLTFEKLDQHGAVARAPTLGNCHCPCIYMYVCIYIYMLSMFVCEREIVCASE